MTLKLKTRTSNTLFDTCHSLTLSQVCLAPLARCSGGQCECSVSGGGYCTGGARGSSGTTRFAEQHATRLAVHCSAGRRTNTCPARVLCNPAARCVHEPISPQLTCPRTPRGTRGTRTGSIAGVLPHQQRRSRRQLRAQSGLDTRRHLRLWYGALFDTHHRVIDTHTDVHHGNGTEDIMATNQRFKDHVLFISSHCSEIYPHTGITSPAKNIVNVPLKNRATSTQFRKAFK